MKNGSGGYPTAPYRLGLDGSNRPFVVTHGGTQWTGGRTVIPLEAWTHLAATYDGATVRLYVNGALEGSLAVATPLPVSTQPLVVGSSGDLQQPFAGAIDEVRIYARALSANELAADMYAPVDPTTPFAVTDQQPVANTAVLANALVTASFSRPALASSVSGTTVRLTDEAGTPLSSTVAYDSVANRVTVQPAALLVPGGTYTATVVGGGTGVLAADGQALPGDVSWTFRVAGGNGQPVAAWAFSEGSGPTTVDATGNGNTGTLLANAGWTAGGRFGAGLTLTGTSVGVQVADAATLDLTTGLTLEAWVRPTTATGNRLIVMKNGSGGYPTAPYRLGLDGSNRPFLAINGNTGWLGAPTVLPVDAWSHLAATYDGVTLRLFVNGVAAGSAAFTPPITVTTFPLVVGSSGDLQQPFAGAIDEVRIYGRALTISEITADMQTPVDEPPDTTPPAIAITAPTDGAYLASATPNIMIAYSDETGVDASSLQVTVNGLDRSILFTNRTATGASATLPLEAALPEGTASIIARIKDGAGNEATASTSFVVDTVAPQATSMVPAPGAFGVSLSMNVTVAFSEPMLASTITTSTFELRDSADVIVPATVTYDVPTRTAVLHPLSALSSSASYTAVVRGGASAPRATDLAGNTLTSDVVWSFSAADVMPPTVTALTPADSSRNVSLTAPLAVTFDEAIDPSTISAITFTVTDTRNLPVPGTVSYDAATWTARFVPTAPLLPTRTYTATVGGGAGTAVIRDVAGNGLAQSVTWSFVSGIEPRRVDAGGTHSIAVDDLGQVWTWGANTYGQRGQTLDARLPGQVAGAMDVASVAAGESHSLALRADGTVLAWGDNTEGQLGDNSQTQRSTPVAVAGLSDVVAIAAGRRHSLALRADGTVWAWGMAGRIGDGANLRRVTPVQITTLTDVIAVAAGDDHSLALRADGTVWGWGTSSYGQVGDNTTNASILTPVQVVSLSNVVSIAAGDLHSLAVVGSDLSVRGWGFNGNGQLGSSPTGTPVRVPVAIAGVSGVRMLDAAAQRSVVALLDGTTRTWGAATLVNGSYSATPVEPSGGPQSWQVATGQQHSLAVTEAGIVTSWSNGLSSTSGQIGDGTLANRVTAVTISEAAYTWKVGTPALNVPSGTYQAVQNVTVATATAGATTRYTINGLEPTEGDSTVPSNGVVVVDRSLTLKAKAWKAGQPASNSETAAYVLKPATPVLSAGTGTYTTARDVTITSSTAGATIRYTTDGSDPTDASAAYTAALHVDTQTTLKVRAFRDGWVPSDLASATYTFNYGVLPTPTASPGSGTSITSVTVALSAASGATIRYTTNGTEPTTSSSIYAGPLTFTQSTTLKAKAFNVDYTASLTMSAAYIIQVAPPMLSPSPGTYTTGTVITAASSTPGATVHYTLDGREPTPDDPVISADAPLFVGDYRLKARAWSSETQASDRTEGSYAATGLLSGGSIAPGYDHTIAVRPDGTVFSWGYNGSVAGGSYTRRLALLLCLEPVPYSNGIVHGVEWASTPRSAEPVGIKQAASGAYHSVAVRADGHVISWGDGWNQAVLGHPMPSGNCPDWPEADRPSAREVPGLSDVIVVTAGTDFSLALKGDGTVWGWGINPSGQLGNGTTMTSGVPTVVSGLSGAVQIVAGTDYALAATSDGRVWGWGNNSSGQLTSAAGSVSQVPVLISGVVSPVSLSASGGSSFAVLGDGTVWTWGFVRPGTVADGQSGTTRSQPVRIPFLSDIRAVADASTVAYALDGEGRVWSWGQNTYGALGDGSPTTTIREVPAVIAGLPPIRSISASAHRAVAIAMDGSVWSWGRNTAGQVGDGTMVTRTQSAQILPPFFMEAVDATPAAPLDPSLDQVRWYHTDAIGSVRATTDATGAVVERFDYKPFGESWPSGQATTERRQFAGKERDSETGLDYFGARYLEAGTGRFISVDPALDVNAAIDTSQRWNRYSYVMNRPLTMTDADGREAGYVYLPNGRLVSPYEPGFPRSQSPIASTLALGAVVAAGLFAPAVVQAAWRVAVNTAVGCFLSPSCQSAGQSLLDPFAPRVPTAPTIEIAFGIGANQANHAIRHVIEETSVAPELVKAAVRKDLSGVSVPLNKLYQGKVSVGGRQFLYNAYRVKDGLINVGRITVVHE